MVNRPTVGVLFLAIAMLLVLFAAGGDAVADPGAASSANDPAGTVDLHFFWTTTCPHCRQAKPFVEALAREYPWLRLHAYELRSDPGNVDRYLDLARQVGGDPSSVPGFIYCGRMLVGFDSPQRLGAVLRQELLNCRASLLGERAKPAAATPAESTETSVSLPLLGRLDLAGMSLPVVTLVLAGLDAFNPCAFFVLLFLLSLLVHARSRVRMAVIGGIFVFFSGLVYFVFMAAWLNVFLVMGQLRMITVIAGLLAIAIAALNLKDFFRLGQGISLSIPASAKPRLFQHMRGLVYASGPAGLVLGTVTLAITANAYELLCTAGFPMVYTRILTLNALPTQAYYFYLLLYNLIYVLPLAVIVVLFTVTLGARKLGESEGRLLKLVSGMMMMGLGVVMLAAPELLNNALIAVLILATALVGAWLTTRVHRYVHASRQTRAPGPAPKRPG